MLGITKSYLANSFMRSIVKFVIRKMEWANNRFHGAYASQDISQPCL
jgi:hypothetical protein